MWNGYGQRWNGYGRRWEGNGGVNGEWECGCERVGGVVVVGMMVMR